jgi:ribosomal protein S18 acetylase RimI-like enzyme
MRSLFAFERRQPGDFAEGSFGGVVMVIIRETLPKDIESALRLMTAAGLTLREADTDAAIRRYLLRNPGFSFTAELDGKLVGCVMSGHDGRRGYLHHLAVTSTHQRKGIATRLVEAALERLEAEGILKSHIDILTTNHSAIEFWEKMGWKRRSDVIRYSFIQKGSENV